MSAGTLKFQASLVEWQAKLGPRMNEALDRVGVAIAKEVIVGDQYSPGTPIDTGYARASWFVSLAEPSAQTVKTIDGAGRGAYGDGTAALDVASLSFEGFRPGMHAYLSNNASYIGVLEYGSSRQAPEGMVRITLAHAQAIVDDACEGLNT